MFFPTKFSLALRLDTMEHCGHGVIIEAVMLAMEQPLAGQAR